MTDMLWGLLGPDVVASNRRTRTLGLGALVREFNERAVPGMGGVWFAKQVVFALLGIEIATCLRSKGKSLDNIRAANAVEALACFIGLEENNWEGEARLRGATKMNGATGLSFAKVSAPGFYVTQPMRMATVQTLPALGLVTTSSSRFNSYRLSERGRDLINACAGTPCYYSSTAIDLLVQWAEGSEYQLANRDGIRSALSPLQTLNNAAAAILHNAILQGEGREVLERKQRRRTAMQWVERLRTAGSSVDIGWEKCPSELSEEHWHDLKSGAAFFALRDAALHTLDHVEHSLGRSGLSFFNLSGELNTQVESALGDLRRSAERFLELGSDLDAATTFARICTKQEGRQVLAELVVRDGRVLRLVGNAEIRPASAYLGVLSWLDDTNGGNDRSLIEEGDQTPSIPRLNWPDGISGRVPNLFLFNADLKSDLKRWISTAPVADDEV